MFPQHTLESAPEASKETLKAIEKSYGFMPNLALILAGAPTALNGYISLMGTFTGKDTGLNAVEQQVVLLAASVENGCDYCTAAHGTVANMAGLAGDEVRAVQRGDALSDSKLEALRQFTVAVVEKRGWATEADINAFTGAGYTDAHIMEVVIGVAIKTITNYVNHMAKPVLNDQFAAFAVTKAAAE